MLDNKEFDKEVMHVLVSPTGAIQLSTMSPILEECTGMIWLIGEAGMGYTFETLKGMGFTVEKVEVTIKRI
jgi:tartrate dehydratase beta subunit/fumarate hydratase class I family protein